MAGKKYRIEYCDWIGSPIVEETKMFSSIKAAHRYADRKIRGMDPVFYQYYYIQELK